MSEEAINQENEEITTDKFFGVKHDIVTPKEDVEVEVLEEESNLPDPKDVKVAKEPEVKTEEVPVTDEDLDKTLWTGLTKWRKGSSYAPKDMSSAEMLVENLLVNL